LYFTKIESEIFSLKIIEELYEFKNHKESFNLF